jgi:glutathione synthase/RimK-type ligase-like ATP-grasp enzyme
MIVSYLHQLLGSAQSLLNTVRRHGPLAKRDTGKGIVSQLAEIIALHYGIGQLAADEYYQYRLYDDRQYRWHEKKKFIGRALENGLIPILRERPWVGLAHDKLASYAFLKGLGFPVPDTYAIYHPFRSYGSVPVLRTFQALARFIRAELTFPFVAKPVAGMWGRHVWAVESYDRTRDRLRLTSGQEVEVEALIEDVASRKESGVLFQELLTPHPMIEEWCGDRICSVRMVSIIDRSGARLISTLWKVATGSNMADNYWGPGNLVGPIETGSGRVGRMFTGLGRDIAHVDQHPDTGRTLSGVILPDWPAAVDLCLRAAATLPGIPMQAWDIALTSKGPVILEVNVNGGMRLPQLVAQRGLYTDEFREFLNGFGYPGRRFSARVLGRR